jgi:aminoglycoside 6'-N-acetyltransferase I
MAGMATEIKILRLEDAARLENLAEDVFDNPLDAAATREFLQDPRHHLAVAIEEGFIVGFASAVHYVHPDKTRPEMWVNEVGVAPSHQKQGLGQALMRTLLARARELSCDAAWVLTEKENTPAVKLYASLGGEESAPETVMFNFPLN